MKPGADNIILIGMPAAGKSTLGVLLAKALCKNFIDTDLLIQQQAGASLQAVQQSHGMNYFRELEERCLLDLELSDTVVATGGSAVYSSPAMARLRSQGRVVFIDVPLAVLEPRIGNLESRGVVRAEGQSFAGLFQERRPLYLQAADVVIDMDERDSASALALLLQVLEKD